MSDDLRTRIAAVIYGAASQWDSYPWDALAGHIQALYLGQADAVIAELQLYREGTESRTVTNEFGATYRVEGGYRYVTDWQSNDDD
jgi:hypothetical protein